LKKDEKEFQFNLFAIDCWSLDCEEKTDVFAKRVEKIEKCRHVLYTCLMYRHVNLCIKYIQLNIILDSLYYLTLPEKMKFIC